MLGNDSGSGTDCVLCSEHEDNILLSNDHVTLLYDQSVQPGLPLGLSADQSQPDPLSVMKVTVREISRIMSHTLIGLIKYFSYNKPHGAQNLKKLIT